MEKCPIASLSKASGSRPLVDARGEQMMLTYTQQQEILKKPATSCLIVDLLNNNNRKTSSKDQICRACGRNVRLTPYTRPNPLE